MAGPIIVCEREMLKSKAFRSLTSTAMVILFDFLMRRRYKGKKFVNNGEIVYPFSEAAKKGIPAATFNRNRDLLIERGFLEITRAGSGGKKGDMTLYALSDRWQKWGKDTFKTATRPKDERKGIGFAAYHKKKVANAGDT